MAHSPKAGVVSRARLARFARSNRAARRAFTLVELAIVVAIVGVLAVLAVVGYRKLTLSAKVSEARQVIGGIRIAQEDYKVERGTYANIGPGYCPSTGLVLPPQKTGWDPTCGGAIKWSVLPVHIDGPVQFGYRTEAGINAAAPGYGFVTTTGGDITKPWYSIHAQADLAADGGNNTELAAYSFGNIIYSRNEGE